MVRVGTFNFKSGDIISCKIKGYIVKNGRVHFRSDTLGTSDVRGWICHSVVECSGDESPDRYGFEYSWGFHILDGNRLTDGVSDIVPYFPTNVEVKKVTISNELDTFLKLNQFDDIVNPLFYSKVGIFDEYTHYKMSDTDGCIILSSGILPNAKKIEIKLSRFVRQVSTKLNELLSGDTSKIEYACGSMDVSDKTIEKIYNAFVSYQKNDKCTIHFLKGEDILQGYDRENYLYPEGGTLHKSCMIGYPQYLELYTKNPNQVQLAVVYIQDKIAARGLVWTAIDGKMYSDRIYYKHDWLEKIVSEKLRSMGIEFVQEKPIRVVQLEKWEFTYYPYVDSFYSFDRTTGLLVSFGNGMRQLRNTNGNI